MARETRIHIPQRLTKILQRDRTLEAGVLSTLAAFEPWLEDNKLVFFPEFTDHGPDHIGSVIATASVLINPPSWRILTAGDAAALIMAVLLHDCAMHLSEDGFIALVTRSQGDPPAGETPWPQLWEEYLREAIRFDGRKLFSLFGDTEPIRIPTLSVPDLTRRDRVLIGDFLRRHHARLAYEIAMTGVPGPSDERLALSFFESGFRELAGWIARSHGMSIREAAAHLDRNSRRVTMGVHATYVMALLRIADYLQIEATRAPREVLQVRSLRSPISRAEWSAHNVIPEITSVDDDRESLHIVARPLSAKDFVHVTKLLQGLQTELDQTWATLGEVYGPVPNLQKLGLTIRRIRSNLDDVNSFAREVNFVPVSAGFTAATPDLLKLLIGPLYDYRPEIGIRELLQNAVDAVIERRDISKHREKSTSKIRPLIKIDLVTNATQPYLSIIDTGVGMTVDVLLNYFLRAGASFRYDERWLRLHTDNRGRSRVLRSGRFGIGALAGFLLADSLSVTTRALDEEHGLAFEARIEDENIELYKTSAPVGTTIRVLLGEGTAKHLGNTNLWDFYCLKDPIVERRLNGKPLKQRETWPSCAAQLPPTWRRLENTGFADVQWSFWEPEQRTQIACNGIRVEEIRSEDEPDRSHNDEYENGDDGEEFTPRLRLSIFDREARLPLNLQRTTVTTLPFRQVLEEEIAKDFLAFAATRLPDVPNLLSVFHPALYYPGYSRFAPDWSKGSYHRSARETKRKLVHPCFFASPDGWLLPVYSALRNFRPDRILYIIANPPGPPLILRTPHYVCSEIAEFDQYSRHSRSISNLVDRVVHYCPNAKMLAPIHTIREMIQHEGLADRILRAQTTPFGASHSIIDFDNRTPSVVFSTSNQLYHNLTNESSEYTDTAHYLIVEIIDDEMRPDGWSAGAGIINDGPRLPISYDLALAVWSDLGIRYIPFAKDARKSILEHPQIRPYAEAHTELWELGSEAFADDPRFYRAED